MGLIFLEEVLSPAHFSEQPEDNAYHYYCYNDPDNDASFKNGTYDFAARKGYHHDHHNKQIQYITFQSLTFHNIDC